MPANLPGEEGASSSAIRLDNLGTAAAGSERTTAPGEEGSAAAERRNMGAVIVTVVVVTAVVLTIIITAVVTTLKKGKHIVLNIYEYTDLIEYLLNKRQNCYCSPYIR